MCWIFDEFEKANSRRLENCLLQILDWPHRYTDNTGMDLDFSRCIFFFTSNVGHSRLEKRRIGFQGEGTVHHRRSDIHLLTKYFKEELIGRFGENIFHFNPLNGEDYSQIIDLELRRYERENRIRLTISDKARDYFIASAEERGTGARGLINKMAKDLDEAGLESLVNDSSIHKKVFHIIKTKNSIKVIHKGKH
jgi:ATP-dependent Clp protease ATP-binding subunit ClpA